MLAEPRRGRRQSFLDQYAKGLADVYDEVWQKEYRWAAQFHGKPEYDFVLHPPKEVEEVRQEASEPAVAGKS